jgi:hypothetical protein
LAESTDKRSLVQRVPTEETGTTEKICLRALLFKTLSGRGPRYAEAIIDLTINLAGAARKFHLLN